MVFESTALWMQGTELTTGSQRLQSKGTGNVCVCCVCCLVVCCMGVFSMCVRTCVSLTSACTNMGVFCLIANLKGPDNINTGFNNRNMRQRHTRPNVKREHNVIIE